MVTAFDKFEHLETPTLTLCNPNSEATVDNGKVTLTSVLGVLTNCRKVVLSPNFNSPWELSFECSDSENEQLHYVYKRLEKGRYIYVSDVGYFIIDDTTRHESDTDGSYKEISCHSVDKEIERNSCPLLEEGSYYFYTHETEDGKSEEGIIQKQMLLLPKWTLGFVSDRLKDKTAYFDGKESADSAYDFLWNKGEEAYEYIIDADFITRTLNFYATEDYAAYHKTDIHLSKSNDLKGVSIESKDDDCFTAITVQQDDNLSLVYSNPNGSETLYNFSYWLGSMSAELQAALAKWEEKYNASIIPYRQQSQKWAVAQDAQINAEKDLEKLNEELKKLQTQKDAKINEDISDDSKNKSLSNLNSQIKEKEHLITDQKKVVDEKTAAADALNAQLQEMAKECSLDLTAKDIHGNTIFTEALINELSAYIKSAEYTDEYITQTDDMKFVEIYEQSNKLFDRAKGQLNKLAVQSFTFSVENNSFLFNKKFKRFSDQLCPGAIIYLETSDDHMEQVHLTNFSIDYDEKTVSFTFGNKYDENDIKSLFDDVFGSVKTSAAQIKYLKNVVNDQRSLLQKQQDWIDNAFTLTKDHILTSNNQSFTVDDSGYWGRRRSVDKDGNFIVDTNGNPIYDNEQIKIINNGVYLTTDNWGSIATAIGKIWLYHDDEKNEDVFRYGVAGDVIVGKLFLGKELNILGGGKVDGTNYYLTMNEDGIAVINDGTHGGIVIKKAVKDAEGNITGYTTQFSADDEGNLYLDAKITAKSGNIGGWNIKDDGLYFNNDSTGCGLWGTTAYDNIAIHAGANSDNITSAPFRVYHNGRMVATSGNIDAWEIGNGGLYYVNGTSGCGLVGDGRHANIAFYAGANTQNIGGAPFRVYHDGSMYATSGTVGGWNLSATALYGALSGMSSNVSDFAFWAGDGEGWKADHTAPFRVTHTGQLYAREARIVGNITATSGTFTGTVNATDGTFTGTINAAQINGSTINVGSKLGNLTLSNWGDNGAKISHDGNGHYGSLFLSHSSCSLACTLNGGASVAVQSGGKGYLTGSWAYWQGSSGSLSDKSMKTDIVPFTDNYNRLFDNLQPCLYKYIEGTSGRKHFGFIAQDTEDAITKSDLTQKDVAFIMDMEYDKDDGTKDKKKFLRYEEFVALNTWQIQNLKAQVKELESKIATLS